MSITVVRTVTAGEKTISTSATMDIPPAPEFSTDWDRMEWQKKAASEITGALVPALRGYSEDME